MEQQGAKVQATPQCGKAVYTHLLPHLLPFSLRDENIIGVLIICLSKIHLMNLCVESISKTFQ